MILKGFEKYILVIIVFFSSVGKIFDGKFSSKVNKKSKYLMILDDATRYEAIPDRTEHLKLNIPVYV